MHGLDGTTRPQIPGNLQGILRFAGNLPGSKSGKGSVLGRQSESHALSGAKSCVMEKSVAKSSFKRPSGSAIAAILVVVVVGIFVAVGTINKEEVGPSPDALLPANPRPLKTTVISVVSDGEQQKLGALIPLFDDRTVF